MSLLEGHADYVMDGVGPGVVPTVEKIRAAFQERRTSARGLDALLRKLLGMEAKLRQYRDGEKFVRGVVDAVGMDGFNEVWSTPETLPSMAEVHDPDAWVARVHGPAPARRSEARVGPHPATADVRRAVGDALADLEPGATVLVACSGGADSLALAAALAFVAPAARCGRAA